MQPAGLETHQKSLSRHIFHNFEILVAKHCEMPAEAGRTPAALIDAVHRIAADNLTRAVGRALQHPLLLIAYHGDAQVLAVFKAEDGAMAAAGHLPAAQRIIRRCRSLDRMVQRHRRSRRQDGERAVVLCGAA